MKTRRMRPLRLTRETLRALTPSKLHVVRGGSGLVTEPDPATAPDTDRDGRGPARTDYSCHC
jgi:hypothetical protein